MLKIGFTGTGASGKTSVAKPLATRLGIPYRASVVRETYERVFPNMTDAEQHLLSPEDRYKLQQALFLAGLRQQSLHNNGVFDRVMTCYMAYSLYQSADVASEEVTKLMLTQVKETLATFNLIVYFPLPTWEPAIDPFRKQNYAYRMAIDTLILGLLKKLSIPHVVAADADPEGRVADVLRHLDLGRSSPGEPRSGVTE